MKSEPETLHASEVSRSLHRGGKVLQCGPSYYLVVMIAAPLMNY